MYKPQPRKAFLLNDIQQGTLKKIIFDPYVQVKCQYSCNKISEHFFGIADINNLVDKPNYITIEYSVRIRKRLQSLRQVYIIYKKR